MPDTPQVWNLRTKNYPKGAVYCGRGTPWGNPYIGGKHGSRDTVCDKFEKLVLPELDVEPLRGKHLLCWCKPLRCHCDAILKKANTPLEEEYEISRIGDHALAHGDCLRVMEDMENQSIDLILADLPYGTTANKWDSVIPLNDLWAAYERVAKPTAAIVLTASQPFTSVLVTSNLKMFKHEWVWIKNRGSNFANTVREPMKEHESVLVFSKGKWTYNKQMQPRTGGGLDRVNYAIDHTTSTENYGSFVGKKDGKLSELRVPSTWQKFNCEVGSHPTQKPVDLMAYLIRTYSNPGDLVLDNTMGSGTTGVACVREGRRFRGIEQERKYFDIAAKRVSAAVSETN